MKNLILVFLNDLENLEELNKMLDNFDSDNNIMELYSDIKNDDNFDESILPNLIEFYKKEYKDINKIIVLSNSRDLLFFWYRVYNSLVDDFIYFIDEDEKDYFNVQDENFSFYYNITSVDYPNYYIQ